MNLWLMHLALPVQAWLPLGLALLAPLLVVAVALPLSRRRSRGIATVLALRTVTLLAVGFAVLATVATVAVVHTGLRELAGRHAADVRSLADALERKPFGLGAADTQLRLALFQTKDPDIAFVVAGTDGCRTTCVLSVTDPRIDSDALKAHLIQTWPATDAGRHAITIDRRPYLLVAASLRTASRQAHSMVIAAIDAEYLADQAAHTAWLLLAISYVLLVAVGWSSWQQVSRSLASRIHAINTQLLSGNADESHEGFAVDGHELRELASSVSAYIKRTLEEKSSSDERYRRLVELAPDAVLMCADTRIRSANPAAIAMAGAQNRGDVITSTIDRFLKFDDSGPESARSGGGVRLATWTQLDGSVLHVEVAEIADSIGGELVRQFVVRDVTHSRRREADLAHRAEHDSLTGLVNRSRFESRLRELLAPGGLGKARDATDVAVLFIDLDDFKPVNDTYGHAAGDAVLVSVAARLRDSTRGSDLIARLGGDEFAVLLEVRDPGEADAVAERVLRALHLPIDCEGNRVSIRASIGSATTRPSPDAAEPFARAMTAGELLKAADAAMYAAKSAGGDRYISGAGGSQEASSDINFPAVA
jgi:diguanylate cyclase (GGDEF)-like protein